MIRYENECVGCDNCYGCGRKSVKTYYCDICGEQLEAGEIIGDPEENYGHYCEDCYKKDNDYNDKVTFDNVISLEQKNHHTTQIEINDFYAYLLTDEQITELMTNAFKALPEDTQKEYLNDYTEQVYSPQEFIKEIDIMKRPMTITR